MHKMNIKKVTKIFEILFFITVVINVFYVVTKRETKLNHSDYKVLVQESAGSSNYVTYPGYDFPKRGYTLASYTCDTNATITQNTISKALSFTGPANRCTLKFDIYSAATGQTLAKLQELSNQWTVNSDEPDLNKTSPRTYFIDDGFSGSSTNSNSIGNRYFTYASSYTFDENTGKYTLVNPNHCRFSSCTSTLNDKYIVSYTGTTSNSNESYTNLNTIYKVTSASFVVISYSLTYSTSSSSSNTDYSECGIWQDVDDYGTSYYVRGKYDYNYVKFGKNSNNQDLYWRIIRINGDESLRLMYAGTSASAKSNIGTSAFNTSINDNAYVGYMYGTIGGSTYNATHTNTTNSTIKTAIDNYYKQNLSSYSDYLADEIFCNNRSLHSGDGYGTETTYYGFDDYEYSFKCKQKNDAFTVYDTENGNGKLTYPIGMITADEVVRAGITGAGTPTTNFLTKDYVYFTMTPHDYASNSAYIFGVTQANILAGGNSNNVSGVVPVINLTPEAVQLFTGTGTMSDPFVITEGGGTTTPKVSLVNKIQSLSASDSSLVQDGTSDNNLRYIGSNPNNYIYFNNELWRIIGVMNNVKDSNGTSASRVKIVRNESIGTYSWDSSWTNVNSSTGVNEWSQAKLMQLLNSGYDNVKDSNDATVNNSLYWNKGSGLCYNNSTLGTTSCSFNNSGLSEIAQNQIENINWNTGALNADDYKDSSNGVVSKLYTYERGTTTGKICSTTNMLAAATCNDSVTRTTNWIGKVALIYSTDYIYATAGGSSKTRTQCLNYYANAWNSSGYSDCYNNSWLYSLNGQWALSPVAQSSAAVGVMKIDANGSVGGIAAANPFEVRPAVYLKQDISYYSGSGTSTDPFIIN